MRNTTEFKVGQIWEVKGGTVQIKIEAVDITSSNAGIKGECVVPGIPCGGLPWYRAEKNTWSISGAFWGEDDDDCPHDLYRLVLDAEPAKTLAEKIAIMQAVQDGATLLVDAVPTKVEDCTWEWNKHSYTIDTRKSIEYRLALLRNEEGSFYTTTLHSRDVEPSFVNLPKFIRWLTDWTTIYIEEVAE